MVRIFVNQFRQCVMYARSKKVVKDSYLKQVKCTKSYEVFVNPEINLFNLKVLFFNSP